MVAQLIWWERTRRIDPSSGFPKLDTLIWHPVPLSSLASDVESARSPCPSSLRARLLVILFTWLADNRESNLSTCFTVIASCWNHSPAECLGPSHHHYQCIHRRFVCGAPRSWCFLFIHFLAGGMGHENTSWAQLQILISLSSNWLQELYIVGSKRSQNIIHTVMITLVFPNNYLIGSTWTKTFAIDLNPRWNSLIGRSTDAIQANITTTCSCQTRWYWPCGSLVAHRGHGCFDESVAVLFTSKAIHAAFCL